MICSAERAIVPRDIAIALCVPPRGKHIAELLRVVRQLAHHSNTCSLLHFFNGRKIILRGDGLPTTLDLCLHIYVSCDEISHTAELC
mmetsp:Transcript_2537/g.6619  ORF Transcript_2537/g.6619 Transcript_2537/m.6619 type:complete len:87 (-) Transcript_2537:189-449(-)